MNGNHLLTIPVTILVLSIIHDVPMNELPMNELNEPINELPKSRTDADAHRW